MCAAKRCCMGRSSQPSCLRIVVQNLNFSVESSDCQPVLELPRGRASPRGRGQILSLAMQVQVPISVTDITLKSSSTFNTSRVTHVMLINVFSSISHTRTVVRECCKGDEASQWRNPKFDPPPRPNPVSDRNTNRHT